jgi:dTDP-4-amino-4,6-dideoxygalactose transaminase
MKKVQMLDLKLEYKYMKDDIDAAIKTCLEHQKWILGPEVKELEEKIANYIGVKHCIGVASGTEALILSLRALAIKTKKQEYWDKEDLIITTPFTFTATGDTILRSGGTPVFVDIDPQTFNIDTKNIKKALYKYGSKIKGIIPVHLYGQPCNMFELASIAKENDIFIVEDCAQSFGAKFDGKQTGSFGNAGCFSFFPSKNLGCFGDGGMVSTNDDELAEIIKILLKHGGKDKYNVEHIGYNARLDTIQAAVLLAKFKHIDEFTQKRRKAAEIYNKGLKDLEFIDTPFVIKDAYHVYHQYTIMLKGINRDEAINSLNLKGVQTMVYYPYLLTEMALFKKRCITINELENAKRISGNVLSLPIEPLYVEDVFQYVTNCIKELRK